MRFTMWRYRDQSAELSLHIGIFWPPTPLRRLPGVVAVGIFDVAGFAVDAVLRVDHKARLPTLLHPLIDPGRAVARRRPRIDVMLRRLLERHVAHPQVRRLVLPVIGAGPEHRRQPVEGQLAVRPRIVDPPVSGGGLERLGVGLAVAEGAEEREAERVAPHIETAGGDSEDRAELRP